MPNHTKFDLLLVITAFQRNCIYASIIKELASSYNIGIVVLPLEENANYRIQETQQKFIDLCLSFGATLVDKYPIKTNIEILGQALY